MVWRAHGMGEIAGSIPAGSIMAQEIQARLARLKDAGAIYGIGRNTKAFAVSNTVPFYLKKEVIQWIKDKKDNLVMVAESNSRVIGFASCKIMSYHEWAMVDNFYVLPRFRKKGVGTMMERFLEKELRKKGIHYMTRLVRPGNRHSRKFLRKSSFKEHGTYIWVDKFLRH